jgi:hypothetical protein
MPKNELPIAGRTNSSTISHNRPSADREFKRLFLAPDPAGNDAGQA